MRIAKQSWLPPADHPSGAVDRHGARRWLQLLMGIVVFAVAEVAHALISLVAVTIWPGSPAADSLGDLVGMAAGAAVALAGMYWIGSVVARRPGLALAGRGRMREFAIGLGIGAALMSVSFAVVALLGGYRVTDVGWSWGIVTGLGIGIGAGFMEEVLFRGILLRLLDEWLGSWWALAITAVIFGLMHLGNPEASLGGAVSIAVEAGILLGAAYLLTRRLWLAFGIHLAWNTVQSSVFGSDVSGTGSGRGLFEASFPGPAWLTGGEMGIEGSLVTVLVCTAAGVAMLVLAVRRGRLTGPESERLHAAATGDAHDGVRIEELSSANAGAVGKARPAWGRMVPDLLAAHARGDSVTLIAFEDTQPVGLGELVLAPTPELRNLGVLPASRGRGIGTRLIAAAEQRATPLGRLSVGVGVDNPRARALYERLGFVSTGSTSTVTYTYVDDDGISRTATETSQMLVKELRRPQRR